MADVPRVIVTAHDGTIVGDLDPARLAGLVVVSEVNGEMSSWFVLNAIGIYTYSPADPEYIVTVPLFDKVHFTLGDGQRFDIIKQGKGEKIKRITIGGTPLKGWFVKHEDLAKGKELLIVCGDVED